MSVFSKFFKAVQTPSSAFHPGSFGMAAHRKEEYFRLPVPWAIVVVPFGMALTAACAFCPDLIPYGYLGPVGWLAKYLVEEHPVYCYYMCMFAWSAHAGEAVYSVYLARNKGLNWVTTTKWCTSIFFYGIFSLRWLLNYKPGEKKAS